MTGQTNVSGGLTEQQVQNMIDTAIDEEINSALADIIGEISNE